MAPPANSPLVLIVRDGWGQNPNPGHNPFNAVSLAHTPVARRLTSDYPGTLIKTSGEDVGLPDSTMGNSEVGHQNIGAGRIVYQDSVRITIACREGRLRDNAALLKPIERARDAGKAVHLMGICSDAGVHGLLEHLYALVALCRDLKSTRVFVHLFTDGRDTGPFTGKAFIGQVETKLREFGVGSIASMIGRYYAMDRDNRWERVARAYACLTGRGTGAAGVAWAPAPALAAQAYYDRPSADNLKGDEFITPTMIGASESEARAGRIGDGDTVIFYNYRGDRPRELIQAFVLPPGLWAQVKPSPDTGVKGFERGPQLTLDYVTLAAYWDFLDTYVKVAFPKQPRFLNILGEYISRSGLRQFRCAETEKYPHVTFFFNDYREEPFPGERRENPQSPKVSTYDLKPEMAAYEVRDAVLRRLVAEDCEDFLVVNFANADMVGHTGNLLAAIKACEVVDSCVGSVVEAALKRSGSLIVTADHGNAEQMWDPVTKAPHTAHTTFDVPLIVVGSAFKGRRLRGDTDSAGWFRPEVRAGRGRLADIAPTVLDMMGISKPEEMTGQTLLR